MKRTIVLAVLAVALTACGGGEDKASAKTYPDTKSLAGALGCANTHAIDRTSLPFGAKELGKCGQYPVLAVFASNDNRDAFVKGVGALGGSFVVGEKWVVATKDVASANRVAESMGAKVV